ncbi:MAG: hypothetical protein ACFFDI_10970 [Promethearchaeota archaeon]
MPGTEYFYRIITELGGSIFYFGVFFIIFWGINKKFAKSLFLVYVSSNFVNYYAKAIIANERPPQSEWLLIDASHLSTPSGHCYEFNSFLGISCNENKKIVVRTVNE